MENIAPVEQMQDEQRLYAGLDRFLLYLITAELGYLVLLIIAGIALAVSALVFRSSPRFIPGARAILPFAPLMIALPANVLAGLAGLVLTIRTRRQGFPGTGHLLNWMFIASNAWVFIVAFMVIVPGGALLD